MLTDAVDQTLGSAPGTYALHLELSAHTEIEVGRLGHIRFDSPYYLYFGSAFGPGGLRARLRHHLKPARRAHWHIDYLRQKADVIGIWFSEDEARLECTWANAASAYRGVSTVPGFGSSDCTCQSHLVATQRLPSLRAFRMQLGKAGSGYARVRELCPFAS